MRSSLYIPIAFVISHKWHCLVPDKHYLLSNIACSFINNISLTLYLSLYILCSYSLDCVRSVHYAATFYIGFCCALCIVGNTRQPLNTLKHGIILPYLHIHTLFVFVVSYCSMFSCSLYFRFQFSISFFLFLSLSLRFLFISSVPSSCLVTSFYSSPKIITVSFWFVHSFLRQRS